MPIKPARPMELRGQIEGGAMGVDGRSWTTILFVFLAGYLIICAGMKMEGLQNKQEEKANNWGKCLDSYTSQVCTLKDTADRGQDERGCSQLFECIRAGERVSLPEQLVFMIENTFKDVGVIGVPLLLLVIAIRTFL